MALPAVCITEVLVQVFDLGRAQCFPVNLLCAIARQHTVVLPLVPTSRIACQSFFLSRCVSLALTLCSRSLSLCAFS